MLLRTRPGHLLSMLCPVTRWTIDRKSGPCTFKDVAKHLLWNPGKDPPSATGPAKYSDSKSIASRRSQKYQVHESEVALLAKSWEQWPASNSSLYRQPSSCVFTDGHPRVLGKLTEKWSVVTLLLPRNTQSTSKMCGKMEFIFVLE